ncbi:MAG TPA: sialate O-acetylesterase [Rariglobus sp.]|jgi:hypothetical protein|nr:sialate O-acetylesterase [Rariglobus sp.]
MKYPALIALTSALLLGLQAQAETIEVYLVGGQSNCSGHAPAKDLSAKWQAPQADVFYSFKDDTGPLTPRETFGPEVSFGRSMADYFKASGKKVALLQYAIGGTNLYAHWKGGGNATTAGDGNVYRDFQASVAHGMAELKKTHPGATIVLAGMIWMQGEADAFVGRTDYVPNLTAFIGDIRKTYGSSLPFFIGQLSPSQTAIPKEKLEVVRKAQATVSSTVPHTYLVKTGELPTIDHLHFTAAGQITLGEDFAKVVQQNTPAR